MTRTLTDLVDGQFECPNCHTPCVWDVLNTVTTKYIHRIKCPRCLRSTYWAHDKAGARANWQKGYVNKHFYSSLGKRVRSLL